MLISMYPIVTCFDALSKFFMDDKYELSGGDRIDAFVQSYRNGLYHPAPDFIKAIASGSEKQINKFLASIGKEPYEHKITFDDIVMISYFKLALQWQVKGIESRVKGVDAPMVQMKNGFDVLKAKGHAHPVLRLNAKDKFHVFITVADKKRAGWSLVGYINALNENLKRSSLSCDLYFPMVNMASDFQIKWLHSMRVEHRGQLYLVTDARQENILQVDHRGVKTESTTKIKITKGIRERIVIDKPFFLWIMHRDYQHPIIYGYVGQKHWRNPNA